MWVKGWSLGAGAPGWIFFPGLARPVSKSRSPCGLQPGGSHFSVHPVLLCSTPLPTTALARGTCQPRLCRARHGPGAVCPHLALLSQPGPPSEDKGQVRDWEPDKGKKLRLGCLLRPKIGNTSRILEFCLGDWSNLEFRSNTWKDLSNKSSK